MSVVTDEELYRNLDDVLEQVVMQKETVTVTRETGNVVIVPEEEYTGLLETIKLLSIPNLREKLEEGIRTSVEECFSDTEVDW